jgi:hypothetical protein
LLDSDYREYAEPITHRHWKTWQYATESCLSEFEPRYWIDESGRTMSVECKGYTPLFTRKG